MNRAAGISVCTILLSLTLMSSASSDEETKKTPADGPWPMFMSGERLTYSISWSKVLEAGVAVLEVKYEPAGSGRPRYRVVSTAWSVGIVKTFYPVSDTVQSIMDAEGLYSLSYELNQKHGKRKKHRIMTFDHSSRTVQYTSDGRTETHAIPPRVQDPLSSLYYIRTLDDFKDGGTIVVDVFDKGKNWSVDVQILGREKVKTPVGEFDTVKLRTYPKFEGVFQHKGEIFIWLTDDSRRIPVLMKSTIAIGSIVATLIEMKHGDDTR